ncbi:MAG: nuclear transport factor 2 family protein [Proteobacteria bacterium]|nr:MAG: nuclear transport factor 2 family protein [Pseudomonadota bacterium]
MEILPHSQLTLSYVIRLHEEAFLKALLERDEAKIIDMLDVRFCGIGVYGALYNRSEFIQESFRKTSFRDVRLHSIRVTDEGNFANSITEVKVDVTLGHSIINGALVISRTWVQRGDTWKMLSFHLTDSRLGSAWKGAEQAGKGKL